MRRTTSLLVFLFFLGVYAFSANGWIDSVDGRGMFRVSENLVENGSFALPPESRENQLRLTGVDGKTYSPTSLGMALLLAPLVTVGIGLTHVLPDELSGAMTLSGRYPVELAAQFLNSIFVAFACALLFRYAVGLGLRASSAALITVVYGLGTIAWPDAKHFFAHPASMFFLMGAAYSLRRQRLTGRSRFLVIAGFSAGWAVVVYLSTVIALPALVAYFAALHWDAIRHRAWRPLLKAVGLASIGLFAGLSLVAFYNWARFGSPVESGYSAAGPYIKFQTPLLYGLYGLLLSTGKSIFLYSPPLLLALCVWRHHHRRLRPEAILGLTLMVTYLVFYAPLNVWHGDWAWGPRYQGPWVPFVILALGSYLEAAADAFAWRWRAALVGAFFVAGVYVQSLGVLVAYESYLGVAPNAYSEGGKPNPSGPDLHLELSEPHFMPNFSPVVRHAERARLFIADAWEQLKGLRRAGTGIFTDGWFGPVQHADVYVRRAELRRAQITLLANRQRPHTVTFKVMDDTQPAGAFVRILLDGRIAPFEPADAFVESEGAFPLRPGEWATLTVRVPARAPGPLGDDEGLRFELITDRRGEGAQPSYGLLISAVTLDGQSIALNGPFSWRHSGFQAKIELIHRSLDLWWIKPLYTDMPRAILFVGALPLLLAIFAAIALVRQLRGAGAAAMPTLATTESSISSSTVQS